MRKQGIISDAKIEEWLTNLDRVEELVRELARRGVLDDLEQRLFYLDRARATMQSFTVPKDGLLDDIIKTGGD